MTAASAALRVVPLEPGCDGETEAPSPHNEHRHSGVVALIAQATFADRLGGFAALGLTLAIVMFGLATQLVARTDGDDADSA